MRIPGAGIFPSLSHRPTPLSVTCFVTRVFLESHQHGSQKQLDSFGQKPHMGFKQTLKLDLRLVAEKNFCREDLGRCALVLAERLQMMTQSRRS